MPVPASAPGQHVCICCCCCHSPLATGLDDRTHTAHRLIPRVVAPAVCCRPYTPTTSVAQRGYVDFVIKLYPDGQMSQILAQASRFVLRGSLVRLAFGTACCCIPSAPMPPCWILLRCRPTWAPRCCSKLLRCVLWHPVGAHLFHASLPPAIAG